MAGGIERILIDLMNAMVKRGHIVGIITWDKNTATPHYKMDKRIKWFKLNFGSPDISVSISNIFVRLRKFRLLACDFSPDIIIGFQCGGAIYPVISTFGKGFKVISAERVSPDLWKYSGRRIKYKIYSFLTFLFSSKITVQLPKYIKYYHYIFRHKIKAIHNPVYPVIFKKKINKKKIILCVARLCFQKNQDLLIDAFVKLIPLNKEWKLVLVGDGEYHKRLNLKVKNLGLQHDIIFCKATKNINLWYQKADIFAFPSFFEGFPNALAEALSFGIPCIGLKNTLGVNSLIQNRINGFLVDSTPDDFSKALKILMDDGKLRKKMSFNARKIILKYSPEKSYFLWEKLFKSFNLKNE
jgi:glycosyltransferase involved in cell wall biosynthesis